MTTRILIVDDHPLMCEGVRMPMEKEAWAEVVGVCGDCATARRLTEE